MWIYLDTSQDFYSHDMMIDMNGPDIESSRVNGRSEGTNSGMFQNVEELQDGTVKGSTKGQSRGPCDQKLPHDEEHLLSTLGIQDVVFNRISSRMMLFRKVIVKSRQVLYPFLPL